MSDTPTYQIPVLTLQGLEGNELTHLSGLQLILAPYTDVMIAFWTAMFCATLCVAIVRGILLPVLRKRS